MILTAFGLHVKKNIQSYQIGDVVKTRVTMKRSHSNGGASKTFPTPWKINGWNLITNHPFRKEMIFQTSMIFRFHVDLQGCNCLVSFSSPAPATVPPWIDHRSTAEERKLENDWVVVSTICKILRSQHVNLPPNRGENKKYLKPPPRWSWNILFIFGGVTNSLIKGPPHDKPQEHITSIKTPCVFCCGRDKKHRNKHMNTYEQRSKPFCHYTDWFIGVLALVYNNPHITG